MFAALRTIALWLGPVALVACALLAVWLVRLRAEARSLRGQLQAQRDLGAEREQDLQQARRMEAVGILAGGIVNNLNNLLAVVLGNARLMSRADGSAGRRDELDRILKASHMAGDLVQELSDFYRQADQTRKPTDLVPVVRDTVKLLRDILPASVAIEEDLRPCGPVLATQAGVQQVLMNLCSNSVQAMRRGGGTLSIRLDEEVLAEPVRATAGHLAAGSYVRLTVADEGRGMDAAMVDRVFEDNGADGGRPGAGLGLRTVQRIVGDHEGATVVRSAPGRGTSVHVYFPLIAWSVQSGPVLHRPSAEPVLEAPGVLIPLPGLEEEEARRGGEPRATVLLVDDEEMVAQVLARGLRRMGYRVVPHVDSRRALADFAQTPEVFDIVVTDQIMPHMSGVRLTRKLQELRPRIPVIICTGFRDSFNEKQAREAGVSDFLLKPTSHRDLATMIDRLVRREMKGRA